MIVINIKDGYNINRKNVKYNFVTDEKLSLLIELTNQAYSTQWFPTTIATQSFSFGKRV